MTWRLDEATSGKVVGSDVRRPCELRPKGWARGIRAETWAGSVCGRGNSKLMDHTEGSSLINMVEERRFRWWGPTEEEERGMGWRWRVAEGPGKDWSLFLKRGKPLKSLIWEWVASSTFQMHVSKIAKHRTKTLSNWTSSKSLKSAHQRHHWIYE